MHFTCLLCTNINRENLIVIMDTVPLEPGALVGAQQDQRVTRAESLCSGTFIAYTQLPKISNNNLTGIV